MTACMHTNIHGKIAIRAPLALPCRRSHLQEVRVSSSRVINSNSCDLLTPCIGCLQVTILNTVNTRLPFLPADDTMDVKEEVRLRSRVLDLR